MQISLHFSASERLERQSQVRKYISESLHPKPNGIQTQNPLIGLKAKNFKQTIEAGIVAG